MFKGEKLEEIRLLNGMSREELAKKIGVSEQAIWQFETNKIKPKLSPTIISLAMLYKVDIDFFESSPMASSVVRGNISFKGMDLSSKKSIKTQMIYADFVHNLISLLDNYLTSPTKTIYSLIEEVDHLMEKGINRKELIERTAQIARELIGVHGNNDDLLYKLEMSGINVLSRFGTKENIRESYSFWNIDDVPYLVLAVGKTFVNRNFDLAYELGHLLLHRAVDFEVLDNSERFDKEQEASEFAINFLLPEAEFIKAFESLVGSRVSQPDQYISLKQHFNVSIKILEFKAFRLGYLTPAQNNYFFRQMHKKNYKKLEPLDRDIPVYKAGKILSMIDVVLNSNSMNIQDLARLMHVSKELLACILNVELTFFDGYKRLVRDDGKVISISKVETD